jgi:hypothetical protein
MKNNILTVMLVMVTVSLAAQSDSVKTTSKGVLFTGRNKISISAKNMKETTLKSTSRDWRSFDAKLFLEEVKKSIFKVYGKDACDIFGDPNNSMAFSMYFNNGTGYIIQMRMILQNKTRTSWESLENTLFDKRFFDLMESLRDGLKNFTVWSQDRKEPYSNVQFVLKDIDEYLKTCSDEKQP